MIQQLFSSILGYPKALSFVLKHRLKKYFVFSGLISLALGLVIFGSVYYFSDDLGDFIMRIYPFETGKNIVDKVLTFFSGIIILALGVILYKHILLVVVGPLMGPLSEKVERIETGVETSSIALGYSILRGLRVSLCNIVRELALTICILMLGLIPVFTPFTTILVFIVSAYYAGCGNIDFHLEKKYDVKDSVRYCKRNKWAMIGNGGVFLLLLFIPIIGLLCAPILGAVSATRYGIQHNNIK